MDKDNESSSLLKRYLAVVGFSLLGYVIYYVINVMLTRMLSPVSYGDFSLVLRLLIFLTPVVLLGTEHSMSKFMPIFLDKNDKISATHYLKWNAKIVMYSTLLVAIIGAIIILVAIVMDYFGIVTLDQYHPFIFTFWLIPIFSALILLSKFLNSAKRVVISVVLGEYGAYFIIFLALIGVTLFIEKISIYTALLIFGITCLMLIALQLILVRQTFVRMRQESSLSPERKEKTWLKTSFDMMKGSLVFGGSVAVNIVMLELLGKYEGEVGQFNVLFIIGSLLLTFSVGVNSILLPFISPSIDKKQTIKMQGLLNLTLPIKFIPIFLVGLAIIIFGESILSHFGEFYIGAYPILLLLLAGTFINSMTSIARPLLMNGGYHINYIYLSLFTLLTIILLDIFLIPKFEILGAIMSFVIASLLRGMARMIMVRKYLKLKILYFV